MGLNELRTARARRAAAKLEVLLAEPSLLARACEEVRPTALEHPGLRDLLEGMCRLLAEGLPADLDHLRIRLDNEPLMAKALNLQQRGLDHKDRAASLEGVLGRFREKERQKLTRELKNQLQSTGDLATVEELLRRLPQ